MLKNYVTTNHYSACQYPSEVQKYIDKEKSFGAFSVRHVGAGQISPRGVLLSISKILVYTNMGFVSCNFIGQASFTWKPALSFCHFKSGGQEGDIEKQKFYYFYYLLLTF